MLKKIITIVSISVLLGTTSFASVSVKSELDAANSLAEQEIINNHINDPENYNLNDNVLRQEIAAVARGVAKLEKKDKCDNIFSDLSDTKPNTWACRNVEVLVDNNLISRNDTFRPEDKITKSEAIAMLIKAIGFDYEYNPESSYNWQYQVVTFAANMGVVDNFTDYNTDATRGWIFQVADVTIKKDEEIKRQIKETGVYSDEAF
ncbi:MAG: S-layer homology domain-containing protein [Candidatus Gracilibacteria bacterium]